MAERMREPRAARMFVALYLMLLAIWSHPASAAPGDCPPGYECVAQTTGNAPYNYLYGYPPNNVPFQYATGQEECQRYIGTAPLARWNIFTIVVDARWNGAGYPCSIMYQGMQNAGYSYIAEYPHQAGCTLVGGTASGTDPNKICVGAATCPDSTYTYNPASQLCERPITCLPPNTIDPDTRKCEPPETYSIELDRLDATIEPTGTTAQNVKTSQEFTVTVKANGNPKSGAAVTIRADVKANTGGHDHHDDKRPKGKLGSTGGTTANCGQTDSQPAVCITGTTNDSGQFTFTFTSSPVSGEHTITATCNLCAGNQDKAEVKVMVEGLEKIPEIPFLYTIKLPNRDSNHPATYYLTKASAEKLRMIALYYYAFTFKKAKPVIPDIMINDASLEWGGVLDCFLTCDSDTYPSTPWNKHHAEHRRGSVVDIRANGSPGSIVYNSDFKFYAKQFGIKVGGLHGSGGGRHYHIKLNNNIPE